MQSDTQLAIDAILIIMHSNTQLAIEAKAILRLQFVQVRHASICKAILRSQLVQLRHASICKAILRSQLVQFRHVKEMLSFAKALKYRYEVSFILAQNVAIAGRGRNSTRFTHEELSSTQT